MGIAISDFAEYTESEKIFYFQSRTCYSISQNTGIFWGISLCALLYAMMTSYF